MGVWVGWYSGMGVLGMGVMGVTTVVRKRGVKRVVREVGELGS